jgi:hypothetical protein
MREIIWEFCCPSITIMISFTLLLFGIPVSNAAGLMDRMLTDYYLLKSIYDPATDTYVELGVNGNFSSYDVQLAIYNAPAEQRWTHFEVGAVVFKALHVPDDVSLSFNGECYVVTYDFDKDHILFSTHIGPIRRRRRGFVFK